MSASDTNVPRQWRKIDHLDGDIAMEPTPSDAKPVWIDRHGSMIETVVDQERQPISVQYTQCDNAPGGVIQMVRISFKASKVSVRLHSSELRHLLVPVSRGAKSMVLMATYLSYSERTRTISTDELDEGDDFETTEAPTVPPVFDLRSSNHLLETVRESSKDAVDRLNLIQNAKLQPSLHELRAEREREEIEKRAEKEKGRVNSRGHALDTIWSSSWWSDGKQLVLLVVKGGAVVTVVCVIGAAMEGAGKGIGQLPWWIILPAWATLSYCLYRLANK